MNELKIKPCPFCGGEAEIKIQKCDYGISGTIITCKKCHAKNFSMDKQAVKIGDKLVNVPVENHTELAIAKWNSRMKESTY